MDNLKEAFDVMPDGKSPPVHYTRETGHLIFDVSMTLERRSRWVNDGNKILQPEQSTFTSVVSHKKI